MARNLRIYKRGGFTLVELLVSIAVLAVMLSIAYSSFARTSSAAQKAGEFMDLNHVSRFIISRMTDDLASASLFPNSGSGYFIGEAGKPDESIEDIRMDKVSFTGFGRRLIAPGAGSDQALISWYALKTPEKDSYTLMRSENFDMRAKIEDQAEPAGTAAFAITDRLVSFEITYFPSLRGEGEWLDVYSSRTTGKIPAMARIKFTLLEESGAPMTRSAIIPMGEAL